MESSIAELRTELSARMDAQREELKGIIAELSKRMDAQRDELKGEIAELRTDLKSEMARLIQRMDTHTRWIVGVQFLTLLTLIAALLRLAHRGRGRIRPDRCRCDRHIFFPGTR